MLEPFECATQLECSDLPSQAGHGALNFLVRCFPTRDRDSDPLDLFARLATLILRHTADPSNPDLGLRDQIISLMWRMLSGSGYHSVHIVLPRYQGLTSDNFATALLKRLRNILLPPKFQRSDATSNKSVWSFVSEYLQASGRTDTLISLASKLAVELAILSALQIDPTDMFVELLGRGMGAKLITASEAEGRAFVIARHVRPFMRTWWSNTSESLKHADWHIETGFPTAAAFVAACDRAAPCSGCALVTSRGLEEIRQTQLPGRHPLVTNVHAFHEIRPHASAPGMYSQSTAAPGYDELYDTGPVVDQLFMERPQI